jgi:hypothetical protein
MLEPCPSCRRHVRASSAVCPFCGRAARSIEARRAIAGTLVLGLALAGCGGDEAVPPPPPPPGAIAPSSSALPTESPTAETTPALPRGALPPPEPSPADPIVASPSDEAPPADEARPSRARARPDETEAERLMREAAEAQAAILGEGSTEAQLERAVRELQGADLADGVVSGLDDEIVRGANAYGGPPVRPNTGGE